MIRSRRDVLKASGVALSAGIAGCLGSGSSTATEPSENESSATTVDSLPTPTLGRADAPVTVAVFEDYACPHCQRYVTNTLPKLREEYVTEGVVRYEHHDFPIPVDERWSWQVASAARGVQDTVGEAAFFQFATAIYDHLGSYSTDVIASVADEVGADPATIRTAAENEVYRPVLEADRQQGLERGVQGTPTVFVDGSATADYDWETVRAAIEDARP